MIKICIFPAKKSPAAGGMSMSVGPLQTSEIVGSTVFCSLNKRNIQYLFTLSS
jgi:hypothetical protein